MKLTNKFWPLLCLCFLLLAGFVYDNGGKYYEISKNLEIFTNIYKEINTHYVDELEPGPLMEKGIDAMLGSLDPYTVYYSESEIESYRFKSKEFFSGISAAVGMVDGKPMILEIIEGGAAYEAGLKAGDELIAIDGVKTEGKKWIEVENMLNGFQGSDVQIVINPINSAEQTTITVSRTESEVNNVPHFEMLDGDIAYANLSTFTQAAAANVKKAFLKLQKEKTPKGYILDLRGNGGGFLSEAVNLCNLFLPKDVLVVTTKSKVIDWDQSYSTMKAPMDGRGPLVVLVDHSSASASEIVSGTIQDYDRGVIIGQRTYGKGLVQRTVDLGYNSRVKLTISEYYIPSGRCIQAVQYNEKGEPIEIDPSKRNNFKTKNGRQVQDGGGVMPDIVMAPDGNLELLDALEDQHFIFRFVNDYIKSKNLELNDSNYDFSNIEAFYDFLEKSDFSFNSKTRNQLKQALKSAESDKETVLAENIRTAIKGYDASKLAELKSSKGGISKRIENEIVSRFFYKKGRVMNQLKNDPEINKAIEILSDAKQYQSILKA